MRRPTTRSTTPTTHLHTVSTTSAFRSPARRVRRRAIVAALAALVASTTPLSPAATESVTAEVRFAVVTDGTAPFDATTARPDEAGGAGLDSGPTNGVVRTGDTIVYRLDWSLHGVGVDHGVLTVGLTPGAYWTSLPQACSTSVTPPSSIDAGTLRCVVGDEGDGATSGSFDVHARVSFVKNTTRIGATATLDAPGATRATAPGPDLIASAAAKANLVHRHPNASSQSAPATNPATGQIGRVFTVPITVEAPDDGKGSEPLAPGQTLRFDDDLSALPPSATAVDSTWPMPPPTAGLTRCGPVDHGMPGVPFGRIGASSTATSTTATVDSGTWVCSYDPALRRIRIEVSGADLDPPTTPTQDSLGLPLGSRSVILAGQFAVWVSDDDLLAVAPPAVRGTLPPLTASWTSLPTGVSGELVTGENGNDDAMTPWYEIRTGGTFESHYAGELGSATADFGWGTFNFLQPPSTFVNSSWRPVVPNQTLADNAGDGHVAPGQPFGLLLSTITPWDHVGERLSMCTQLSAGQSLRRIGSYRDHDFTGVGNIAAIMSGTAPIQKTVTTGPWTDGPVAVASVIEVRTPGLPLLGPAPVPLPTVVEYSIEPHGHDGQCDSSKNWTATPPADLSTVTQVRVTTGRAVLSDEDVAMYIGISASPSAAETKIWETSSQLWSPADRPFTHDQPWTTLGTPYDPAVYCDAPTHPPDWIFNDCLTVDAAQLNLVKTVVSPRTAGLARGETVTFRLDTAVTGGAVDRTRIIDDLPEGLEFVAADRPAVVNGRRIEFDLGSLHGGDAIAVDYTARVTSGAANFAVLTNRAWTTGELPTTGGAATPTSSAVATAQVQTGGSFARLDVQKTTSSPTIHVGGTMDFELHYRNSGAVVDEAPTFIDVLPFNGDGRTPGTLYAGTARLRSVEHQGSERIEYTSASPVGIAPDPDAPSNQPGGTTVWCTIDDVDPGRPVIGDAGCPTTVADSTAIRITADDLEPAAAFSVTVRVDTARNLPGNLYSNEFTGRVANISLPVRSNTATVEVVVDGGRPTTGPAQVTPTTTPTTTATTVATTPIDAPRLDPEPSGAEGAGVSRSADGGPGRLAFTGGGLSPALMALVMIVVGGAAAVISRRVRRRS